MDSVSRCQLLVPGRASAAPPCVSGVLPAWLRVPGFGIFFFFITLKL